MCFARLCSGHLVTSSPPMRIVPWSTKNVPATEFSSVDFPDPFVPITITNEPSSISRSIPCSERTSFGVPGLNVLRTPRSSSTGHLRLLPPELRSKSRNDQRDEYEERRNQLQIVRIQSPAQRDRHQQPEQDRSHDRACNHQAELFFAHQSLANDH